VAKILRAGSLIYLTTLTVVLFLDLFTKRLAEEYLAERSYDVLPFLKLLLIYNRGAAFGMFSDLPDWIRIPLLTLTPIIAFGVTYVYSKRNGDMKISLSMGLIAGGALGNLYDRLFLGKVRDFIHLHVGSYYWPAFNVADASITIAVLLIILHYLRRGQ